jgi:lipopolysaccharide/colanic/teichoic acid biosynthesis glycosyltransferase
MAITTIMALTMGKKGNNKRGNNFMYSTLKRGIDFCLSLLGIIILFPLFVNEFYLILEYFNVLVKGKQKCINLCLKE